MFDLAIIETGNGGDLQLVGNDLAVVGSIENMPYLGMFGGNVEQSTSDVPVADAKDWWGNALLMKSDPSIQFNSTVERTINNTGLTSSGRVTIENAIKNDLQFLAPQATITVNVVIESDDRLNVSIKIVLNNNSEQITIINFKKSSDGDFFILDFNNDFFL